MPDSPDDKIPPQKDRQEHGEFFFKGLGGGVNLESEYRKRTISGAFTIFSLAVAIVFVAFICFLFLALGFIIIVYITHISPDFERTQDALSFVWDVLSSGAPLALTILLWFTPRK